MSCTSATEKNDQVRCGNCRRLLIKDGKLKCPRCGEEHVVSPQEDESNPTSLASARLTYMNAWDNLLIVDTRVHLQSCDVGTFEIKLRERARAGETVWDSEADIARYTDLLYDHMMLVDSLERCRDLMTAGILDMRCFELVRGDNLRGSLKQLVADCIRLQRQAGQDCARASQRLRELKSELSELRRLWRTDGFSPAKTERHEQLWQRDLGRGARLTDEERKEFRVLHDEHFLQFRRNVVRAYAKSKFEEYVP
jgi:phage FluMu protein Com